MNHDHRDSKEIQYTYPMHSEVVKNAPSKCPGCSMELIPLDKTRGKLQSKPSDAHAGHVQKTSSSFAKASEGKHMDHESAMTSSQMTK